MTIIGFVWTGWGSKMTTSFLYIDPGTGSMLLSLIIGLATAAVFGIRALAVKLLFIFSGGKTNKIQQTKIPYLIFSDHKRYWNVFKPICDEFEKRKINLVYYTLSPDDPVLNEKYEFVRGEFIGEGNKGIARMNMVNAGIVIATTPQLDVIQWKRSKTVDCYVHIPHTVDDLGDYRMFGLDYYDVLLASGQNQIDFNKKLEELRPNAPRKQFHIVGSTFMDSALEHLKSLEKHKIDPENPVVLLAPSWGEKSILNIFGAELLDSLRETGFKIVVRPHPQSFTAEKEMIENLMVKYSDFEWNRDNDNLSVLNRCDILITDFSGIIFDWSLLFNKPLIYADAKLNTSCYDADWIDEPLWRFSAAEKIGQKLNKNDFSNLKDIILSSFGVEGNDARELVKNECWQDIGNGAKNIVDFLTASKED